MEMEARSFAPDHSQNVLAKIRDYKRDLENLKTQLKTASRAAPSGEAARKDLVLILILLRISLIFDLGSGI